MRTAGIYTVGIPQEEPTAKAAGSFLVFVTVCYKEKGLTLFT